MTRSFVLSVGAAVAAVSLIAGCGAMGSSGDSSMGFFITSVNPGKGGDLGGLAGADRFCQSLATSAGAGNKTWRAYLSNAAMNGQPAVNARDRIGTGPWSNAKGVVVATTCGNWTKSDGGSAIVGHHDHKGTNPDPVANSSWNSSHGTRGCSVDQLKMSGSAGLMYCFATN